jgi:hypothetical protein
VISGFAASLLIALGLGWLTVGWRWWPPGEQRALIAGSLAAGLGLGVSSVLFLLWSWLVGSPAFYPLAEALLVSVPAGVVLAAARRRAAGPPAPPLTSIALSPRHAAALRVILAACAAAACIAFIAEVAAQPHGGWDAWMTWNMHARAVARGGEAWRDVLRSLPDWSHPDYPLLVPASVARIWTYQGEESAAGPAAIAFLFTFATAGLLYAAVATLRSRTQGALAALLLVTTKFFVLHGASQYADIPLGFFFLATLTLLCLAEASPTNRPRLLILAGLTAGLAAWTKNEGLLFVPVTIAVALLMQPGRERARAVRAMIIGLAPVMAVVFAFKIWMAAPNDLLADQGMAQTAARLLEPERYRQIFGGFVAALLEVSTRGAVPILLGAYALAAGPVPAGLSRRTGSMVAVVVGLMLAGYAAVLLVAPAPRLGTNIRSINRLLLQLWPSMLLAYFCLVRTAEEACRSELRVRPCSEPA